MIQISRTRPVVLKSDSDTESNILREYADFWKIPYELNSSTKGAAIFATGNATASDASRDSPLVISPNGMKEAWRIARSYGLGVSVRNSLISLPVGPGTNVSVRTDVCEFSGPDAEPLLKSGNTQVLTKVRGERVYLLSLNLVGEFSKRVYDGFICNEFSLNARIRQKRARSQEIVHVNYLLRTRSLLANSGVKTKLVTYEAVVDSLGELADKIQRKEIDSLPSHFGENLCVP